jgi:hypothetical protein
MRREEMADLTAFVVVAEERSFTRAGVSGIPCSAGRLIDTVRPWLW